MPELPPLKQSLDRSPHKLCVLDAFKARVLTTQLLPFPHLFDSPNIVWFRVSDPFQRLFEVLDDPLRFEGEVPPAPRSPAPDQKQHYLQNSPPVKSYWF